MSSASAQLLILSEAGFSRLSDMVYVLDPASSPSASAITTSATDAGDKDISASATFTKVENPKHPHDILLFSWMGAAPRHILKYSSLHRELFPSARIILVRTDPKDFWRSKQNMRDCLRPAAELLRPPRPSNLLKTEADTSHSTRPNEGNTFVHVFSNGGCYSLIHLLDEYAKIHSSTTRVELPHRAIMIDSAPGAGTLFRDFFGAVRAFSAGLPKNPLLRRPMQFIISIYMVLYYISNVILRRENAIAWGRRRMNEESLVNAPARRVYVYSKGDKVIKWNEVERHADEAIEIAKKGNGDQGQKTVVEKIQFDDSEHVGHYRRHPTEYIEAVKRCIGVD